MHNLTNHLYEYIFSYKLADSLRSYTISAADPANRDNNGHVPGTFYVVGTVYYIPNVSLYTYTICDCGIFVTYTCIYFVNTFMIKLTMCIS